MTPHPIHRRLLLLVLVMLLGAMPARSARAADDDVAFSVVMAYGPFYLPDTWLPLRVTLTNRTSRDISGEVVCPIKGEDGRITFRWSVTVPAKTARTELVHVYLPAQAQIEPVRKKGGTQPPLFVAEWVSSTGERISRCDVLAQPPSEEPGSDADAIHIDRQLLISLANTDNRSPGPLLVPDDAADTSGLANLMVGINGAKVYSASVSTLELPRLFGAMDPAVAVLLNDVHPDRLDAYQQQALMDYMRTGGVVILADANGAARSGGTWIEPLLPATFVGTRYATGVKLNGAEQKFVAPLDLIEWTTLPNPDEAVRVLSADGHYVHAAYRQIGLGRLVVTSFPVSAIADKAAARALWRQLLVDRTAGSAWEKSQLAAIERPMLQSLVGLKVPPWKAAAAVVSVYLLLVLLIQVLSPAEHRPRAFAAAIALSVVMAGGLGAVTLLQSRDTQLSMASISVLDLDHGGVRHDTIALVGPDSTATLVAAEGAMLRQSPSEQASEFELSTAPLQVKKAEIAPQQLRRIYRASAAVGADQSVSAVGRFDERGLALQIDNRLPGLQGAAVVVNAQQFALGDLASGQSEAAANADNYNRAGAFRSAGDQLREQILLSAMKPAPGGLITAARSPTSMPITLVGWLDPPLPPLLSVHDSPAVMTRGQTLVRTTVRLQPSPIGSRVRVPGAFVTPHMLDTGLLSPGGEWLEQFMPRDVQIGFALPTAMGKLQPTRVTLRASISGPQHVVSLHREQCRNGRPISNPAGAALVTWNNPIGETRDLSFDVEPADVDVNGWVWLLLRVDGPPQGKWSIRELTADYEGVIAAAPTPAVLPTHDAPEPPPAKANPAKPAAKPAAQPRPAAKKPSTRNTK